MADKERTERASLTEEELKRKILNGEIRREDLSIQERERHRQELKKARRY